MTTEEKLDNIYNIVENIEKNKITLLTGRSASGKSLIRKLIPVYIYEKTGKKPDIPHSSQQIRTHSHPSILGGFLRDPEWSATSDHTIHLIKKAVERGSEYFIIDEPEIGLSEELQLGLINYLNENLVGKGCLIICHSRLIAKNLKFDTFINLEGMTYEEWINRKPVPEDIGDFEIRAKEIHDLICEKLRIKKEEEQEKIRIQREKERKIEKEANKKRVKKLLKETKFKNI